MRSLVVLLTSCVFAHLALAQEWPVYGGEPGSAKYFLLPLAANDPAGQWTLRIHDLLSGHTVTQPLTVSQPLTVP